MRHIQACGKGVTEGTVAQQIEVHEPKAWRKAVGTALEATEGCGTDAAAGAVLKKKDGARVRLLKEGRQLVS